MRTVGHRRAPMILNFLRQASQLVLLVDKAQPGVVEIVVTALLLAANDMLLIAAILVLTAESPFHIVQALDLVVIELKTVESCLKQSEGVENKLLIRLVLPND